MLVGKYSIGRTLGEGTFGKVKAAVNTETGEHGECGVSSNRAPLPAAPARRARVCLPARPPPHPPLCPPRGAAPRQWPSRSLRRRRFACRRCTIRSKRRSP